MKALSVRLPWSLFIATGEKTVECRSWKTSYRGPILICTSLYKEAGLKPEKILGHAICIATIDDCVPFTRQHLKRSCMRWMPDGKNYALTLKDIQPIKPIPVKGKLGIFNVDLCPEFLNLYGDDLYEYLLNEEWILY